LLLLAFEDWGSYCPHDYVDVYWVRNASLPPRRMRRFCGSFSNYRPMFAQKGGYRIRFITDDSVSNRGFAANFFISGQQCNPFHLHRISTSAKSLKKNRRRE